MNTPKTLASIALAAALMGASLSAQAEDSLATRVATGVGHAIAAQGNAALAAIRDEIKQSIASKVEQYLPAEKAQPRPLVLKVSANAVEQYVADELACPSI